MNIAFTPWPLDLIEIYRRKGYWIDRPLSDILENQAQTQPNGIAIICGNRQLTYAHLNTLSNNFAAQLALKGIQPGDTALVQLPNVAEFYVVFFALIKMGVVPVNALYSHKRMEMQAYAQQLQPRLLIADKRHALFVDENFSTQLLAAHPQLNTVLLLQTDDFSEYLKPCDFSHLPGGELSPSNPEDVVFFQLSGGSTGTPKLIPRTHNDYYYSIRRSAEICQLGEATRFLCVLPVAHNFPLSSPGALGVFYKGGTVVLAPNPEPLVCFDLIEKHKVTMTALVPSAVSMWLNSDGQERQKLKSLKLLQVGGANFAEALARRVPTELGCQLQQVFGMAEGLVNYTRLDDAAEIHFTCQGRPMCPDDEIKILDNFHQQVKPGDVGQLVARGPYTIRGYYKADAHNSKVFDSEGFYATGDLVEQTPEGNLRVAGRIKDQINRGGEKIAAEEIETLLLQHPAVQQVALVARPDPALGEKSCAFIVFKKTGVRAVALRKFLRERGIADFKIPDHFEILEQLPLTAVGKPDKNSLRQYLLNA